LELGFTEFVVEHYPLSQRTHVNLHTIGSNVLGQLELAQLLAFQHHPVAGRNTVLLLVSLLGIHAKWQYDHKKPHDHHACQETFF
jgi:hypothetical protein